MIEVTNRVKIYEVNGQEENVAKDDHLIVSSHWNEPSKVELVIAGDKITVVAKDLRAAIDNATNSGR